MATTTSSESIQVYETLRLDRDGHVAELTLTRPDLFNRFDSLQHDEFEDAMSVLSVERDVRAIVLASSGKVFSAGGDFQLIKDARDMVSPTRFSQGGERFLGTVLNVPVPVVVALHGDAIGLGATVVLACDAVVACRSARLSDPHVVVGLAAGDGGCVVWPQSIGMLRAKRHLLTGDPVTAEDGHAMGLVTDLVDTVDEVLPAARELAHRVAALPPLAVQGTKRALSRVMQHRASEVLELALAYERICVDSADVREAIASFEERRPGSYQGR